MTAERMAFRTELKQILNIIIHSLYSHKDIFLRELISNASDAIDTVRFLCLTRPELDDGNTDWKIKIVADLDAGTLTISDNGIGMSRDNIVENLGTIARSGTQAFLDSLKHANAQDRPELIGQFGVGFYSAFMVADKVTVVSRMAGDKNAGVRWESDGQGEFVVESVEKEARGTDVVLHIRDEAKEFLQPWRIREIVKKYSDFVAHPIVMDVEKEEEGKKTIIEEVLNSRKAIWLRPRAEVTADEYKEFYAHLTHDTDPPLRTVHYAAEGTLEFKALLYLPAKKPFDLQWDYRKHKGLQLYIQRVFIMDDCQALLPHYLRFVRGVVDSPDLPLNVSREMLQQNALLEKIKSNLTNKILNTLEEMKKKEFDDYARFFHELGVLLKEGVSQDWTNREKIADLLLFESTRTERGKFTSLSEYVERMPVSQKEIYFLTGETREQIENSPYLEACKAQDREVLLLTDPIDEFVMEPLRQFKGKPLTALDRGQPDIEQVEQDKVESFKPFLEFLKSCLTEVKDVRLTRRLKDSAVCLVADKGELSRHMEELLKRMGRGEEGIENRRILELNPDHELVARLHSLHERQPDDARLKMHVRVLYDQAVIAEGSKVKDPAGMARRMNEILLRDLSN